MLREKQKNLTPDQRKQARKSLEKSKSDAEMCLALLDEVSKSDDSKPTQTEDPGKKKITGLPFFGSKKKAAPSPTRTNKAEEKRSGTKQKGDPEVDDVVAQIDDFVGHEDPKLDPTNPANLARVLQPADDAAEGAPGEDDGQGEDERDAKRD